MSKQQHNVKSSEALEVSRRGAQLTWIGSELAYLRNIAETGDNNVVLIAQIGASAMTETTAMGMLPDHCAVSKDYPHAFGNHRATKFALPGKTLVDFTLREDTSGVDGDRHSSVLVTDTTNTPDQIVDGFLRYAESAQKAVTDEQTRVVYSAADILASEFYYQWEKSRPIAECDGTEGEVSATQHDFRHTSYDSLAENWKAENKAAAHKVIEIILSEHGVINLSNPETYLRIGSAVHDAWLERNKSAKGDVLDVDFKDLPQTEKDKDIAQVLIAIELFQIDANARPLSETEVERGLAQQINDIAVVEPAIVRTPTMGLLDTYHDMIREAEIRRQEAQKAEGDAVIDRALSTEELFVASSDLAKQIDNLVTEEEKSQAKKAYDIDGSATIRVIKKHGESFHDIGITHNTDGSVSYATLTITKPVEPGTKKNRSLSTVYREYTLQVRAGDSPNIYYADYPHHEEDLAQPQRNSTQTIDSAETILAEAKKV